MKCDLNLKPGLYVHLHAYNMFSGTVVALMLALVALVGAEDPVCPPPDGSGEIVFFPDPDDCHSYYECSNGEPIHMSCPDGLVWNPELDVCDFNNPHLCAGGTTTPGTPTEVTTGA